MSDPEAPRHIWRLEWPPEWTTWCSDPDPDGEHPDSIEYVRADTIETLLAEREREVVGRITTWLASADDQIAEDLGSAIHAEVKCQREAGHFIGQPFFDLFAAAIRQTIPDDPTEKRP